jgi:uncharacterized repeat protein (TIGR03843 family)
VGIDVIAILQGGEIEEVEGLIPWSSNYTFLVRVARDGDELTAVYKPRRGERRLWDFPEGTLYLREVAAYLLSQALGWDFVPPTVVREGPYGVGAVQLFISHDPEEHYFTFGQQMRAQMKRIALFDLVVNNADRKAGHCLLAPDGHIWIIDHGICFHTTPKLRTVIWEFAGQRIPPWLLEDLSSLLEELDSSTMRRNLNELLSPSEIEALIHRIEALIQSGVYPSPGPTDRYPWPPI